jgi:hypothetical protein
MSDEIIELHYSSVDSLSTHLDPFLSYGAFNCLFGVELFCFKLTVQFGVPLSEHPI